MGYLTVPKIDGKGDSCYVGAKNSDRKFRSNNYSNKRAVNNVIRDITRTREEERYAGQLMGYGAFGATNSMTSSEIIKQFEYVQKVYNIEIRGGNRMFHEVFRFTVEEIKNLGYDLNRMWMFASECASYYFNQGHQVVFAIHFQLNPKLRMGDSPYHIHFAVNSINYENGLKWHSFLGKQKERGELFNQSLCKYFISLPIGLRSPITFQSQGGIVNEQ